MIYSPDTNIFLSSFIEKNEKERIESILLIENELKQSKSVLVNSVKREFNWIINTFHTAIETMLLHLNSSKSLDQAINLLPETSVLDKNELKSGLKLLGLTIDDIDKNAVKREEFAININKKMSEIKADFVYYAKYYFMTDKISPQKAAQALKDIEEACGKINQKHGSVIHKPDTEHWIRTALIDEKEETTFVTKDYFGLKKNTQKHAEVTKCIEQMINNKLRTLFSFSFR